MEGTPVWKLELVRAQREARQIGGLSAERFSTFDRTVYWAGFWSWTKSM